MQCPIHCTLCPCIGSPGGRNKLHPSIAFDRCSPISLSRTRRVRLFLRGLYCNIIPDQLKFRKRRWNLCRNCDYLYLLLFYNLTTFVRDAVIGDQRINSVEGSEACKVGSANLAT